MAKEAKMIYPEGTVVSMAGYRGTYVVKALPPGREHYDFFASDIDAKGRERGFPAVAHSGVQPVEHGPCPCGRTLAMLRPGQHRCELSES